MAPRRPRTLLIASTGGHLEQLLRLSERLSPESGDTEWVTFDDPQSRSLLQGRIVHYVPYVAPRSPLTVARNMRLARHILRNGEFDRVVTTGSAVVLSFLPLARAMGIPCHFIESAARADGPSVTANLSSHIPGVRMYSQYPGWASDSWPYRGAVFDNYRAMTRPDSPERAHRVVITFGTMRTYGFRRAADALVRLLPEVTAPDAEILWQVGVTDVTGLSIDARISVPAHELQKAIVEADLVVAHAGVGSALTCLDLGKPPVLLVRRRAHDEMVDDHQSMIAGELSRRSLAIGVDPDELTADMLFEAMSMAVTNTADAGPYALR